MWRGQKNTTGVEGEEGVEGAEGYNFEHKYIYSVQTVKAHVKIYLYYSRLPGYCEIPESASRGCLDERTLKNYGAFVTFPLFTII